MNPLPDEWEWGGEGINGGDPGLQLWVRNKANLLQLQDNDDELAIKTGEMATLRDDMVYGSFRVGMKMSSSRGTCAAFFWVCSQRSTSSF